MSKKIDGSRFPQHTSFKLYASQLNRARFFKMLSFGGTVSIRFPAFAGMEIIL